MKGDTLLYLAIGVGVWYFLIRPTSTSTTSASPIASALNTLFGAPAVAGAAAARAAQVTALHCGTGMYAGSDLVGTPTCLPIGSVS